MTEQVLARWWLVASLLTAFHVAAAENDAAGNTLEGLDSDQDGVRDDVQRHIMRDYPHSQRLQAALMQLARSYQAWLRVPPKSADAAYVAAVVSNRAVDCVYFVVADVSIAYAAVNQIKEWVVDNWERDAAWVATNRLLDGAIFRADPGADTGSACAFKPDSFSDWGSRSTPEVNWRGSE